MECEQCRGCGQSKQYLLAENPEGAEPGELVLVRAHLSKMLLAAMMLLVLPAAGFFGGHWLGTLVFGTGKMAGCVGLVMGIVIGYIYDRCVASKPGSGYTLMKYPQNINKGDNRFD